MDDVPTTLDSNIQQLKNSLVVGWKTMTIWASGNLPDAHTYKTKILYDENKKEKCEGYHKMVISVKRSYKKKKTNPFFKLGTEYLKFLQY